MMEAPCPECGEEHGELHERTSGQSEGLTLTFECRDCGFQWDVPL